MKATQRQKDLLHQKSLLSLTMLIPGTKLGLAQWPVPLLAEQLQPPTVLTTPVLTARP